MLSFVATCDAAGQSGVADVMGHVTGRVVDLRTREPISKVSVSAGVVSVVTGDDGRFAMDVPSGAVEMRVFTVGYGLLKRRVEVASGATLDVELKLGQEAIRDSQQVTVTTGPYEVGVPDAVSQYTLNNSELQDLSTILANDPFRAVASLPGASANQDFYADFAVRGTGLKHIGVFVDGVLIENPSYALEDSGDIGSLSVVNGDVVEGVSLLAGAFPPKFGNRIGAVLDVETRDGARDRVATRMIADALGVAVTSEGPIGKAKTATWLVSGRQSYLAYLLERLGYSGNLTLNYSDGTGKVSYDPNAHHKLTLYTSYGSTSASRSQINVAAQSASFFTEGRGQRGMSYAAWSWSPSPNFVLQTQGSWTHGQEHDTNPKGADVLNTSLNVYGGRSEFSAQTSRWNRVEAGLESRDVRQVRQSYTQWNYSLHTLGTTLRPLDNYSASEWQGGGYVQDAVTAFADRLTVRAGGRWSYFSSNSESVWLPHVSAAWKAAKRTTVTSGFAQYAQMASLEQQYGAFGSRTLRPERATHAMFGLTQALSDKARLHVEIYDRREHDDVYAPEAEFRILPNGQLGYPTPGPTLGNRLKAYARGFEIQLQRRSANRLSGWISYARSYTKFWQPGTSLSFVSDYDQRNIVSAYGAYRLTKTIDVSGNVRYGTGAPIPGFFAAPIATGSGSTVFMQLAALRNTLRQDDYLRVDARLNKVFVRKHFNLTLHGEIENITAQTNYAYHQFVYAGNVATTRQVNAKREKTLPFLPVAGLTLEF